MRRIATAVTLSVPADVCCRAVLALFEDERWHQAYTALRPGRRYSGRTTVMDPGRRLEVSLAAIEPLTGVRLRTLGYRVTYTFTAVDPGHTTVEVGVEYTLLAAVGGMGMLKPQAEHEVLHRLAAILALESGMLAGTAA